LPPLPPAPRGGVGLKLPVGPEMSFTRDSMWGTSIRYERR